MIRNVKHMRPDLPEGTALDTLRLLGENHPKRNEFEFSILHRVPEQYIIRAGEVRMVREPPASINYSISYEVKEWVDYNVLLAEVKRRGERGFFGR